jgi:hypothetical protein
MDLQRNKSVLTGGEVEELSMIKNFPILVGATTDDISSDVFQDLVVDICEDSGIIQLRYLIDPSILYSKFHSEAMGGVWETHHDLLASLIAEYGEDHSILEIGGADSKLALKTLNKSNLIKQWTIVDPNANINILNDKLKCIKEFFGNYIPKKYEFDMVIHSHVLEHIYNPKQFLTAVSKMMKDGDYHIFSIPNLYVYLKNKYINTITFEHSLFLTEEIVDYLLTCYNFKTEKKIYYGEHSIFYVTMKQKTLPLPLPDKYREYKQLYIDFFSYYKGYVEELNKELGTTTQNVYLFGGHVFSQYLISLGLDISKIKCILDNSQLKNQKRLYGTPLIIKSPNDIVLDENSMVILKTGSYQEEIRMQLLNINPNIVIR